MLDFFCIDEESQDEDDSNGGEEQKMRHGVSNNAVAMSGMFECTVRADEMDEFINDLVNCYNNYVPKCAPESVPFRFPVTTNMFEKPGRNEKRHLATKRFENGYNMRTNWNDIVPGIRELLISWLAERTVALWEAYPKTTEDVNLAGKHCAFQGVAIGPQLMRWRHYLKHNISTPAWYADQSLKDRMDAIGLDISLSGFEANFLANCRKLKDFKVKNGGRNPRVRDPSEAVLTNFRVSCLLQQRRKFQPYIDIMKIPKYQDCFQDADNAGRSVEVEAAEAAKKALVVKAAQTYLSMRASKISLSRVIESVGYTSKQAKNRTLQMQVRRLTEKLQNAKPVAK